ncbi:MAG: cupin domain-containing protein [Pseudomonadota bacterium]
MPNSYHLTAAAISSLPCILNIHPVNAKARRTISSPGDATGLTTLGINIFEVAPGDKSTEYHVHSCEDEAVYVLSGSGTARTGDDTHAIHAGDFIGYPKGGPAHEIQNTGGEPLRLLVMGQRLSEDVIDYPDLDKRLFRYAGRSNDLVDVLDISPLDAAD